MAALTSSTAAASPLTAAATSPVERIAFTSTAAAAWATRQAPMPHAEPFKVCAKAATAAGARIAHPRHEDEGLLLEQGQHLGFKVALPQRHARQMLKINGFDRRRRRCVSRSGGVCRQPHIGLPRGTSLGPLPCIIRAKATNAR